MKTPELIDRSLALASSETGEGLCAECGETVPGIDPQAVRAKCEQCGCSAVYGAKAFVLELIALHNH